MRSSVLFIDNRRGVTSEFVAQRNPSDSDRVQVGGWLIGKWGYWFVKGLVGLGIVVAVVVRGSALQAVTVFARGKQKNRPIRGMASNRRAVVEVWGRVEQATRAHNISV